MKAKNHNAKLSVQVQHMETIARLKGDLAQAISSSSATAAAAAAVSGHSPYSHSHDVTVSRAADDSAVSGSVQRLRYRSLDPERLSNVEC
jgi:hypothetical protein